ncbi:MAG: response regulator, partial [bacterium]|nr:response regulator [bacterium]
TIQEDGNGYLWTAGRNGVSRISKKELDEVAAGKTTRVHPLTFNELDGMKSRWCTGFLRKTRDGKLWLPTSIGLTTIDPGHVETKPTLVIEKFIVDGKIVNIHSKEKEAPPIELAPGVKRLEFFYTGITHSNPHKVTFQIRLTGYDTGWIEMGKTRSIAYTELSPGKYTFNVIAGNHETFTGQGETLTFYLKPYFYQTTWFYIVVALLFLMLVLTLHYLRVRQLRARREELEELVAQRTGDLETRNHQLEKAQTEIRRSNTLIAAKNKQLEEHSGKLKEMDEVKSRFFANISHEFRTPLTLIMGPLEQMITESGETKQKRKLKMMLRNSQRLLGLINQLLELSRFESGVIKLEASQRDMVSFLKGIVGAFEVLAARNELDLGLQTEMEAISLYIDPVKMEEVMYNLLINAVKFTPPGGKITVTARKVAVVGSGITGEHNVHTVHDVHNVHNVHKGSNGDFPLGYVEVSVSDTGPGIPGEQIGNIFDRFYQAESTYEHNRKGSGIGLAIAKELMLLHHGTAAVRSSEGENSGTEFILRLPLGKDHLKPGELVEEPGDLNEKGGACKNPELLGVEEERGENRITDAAVIVEGGEKNIILVVEDNADVGTYVRETLESLYTVIEAKNGEEGIEKARAFIPDLIVSDIMMPGVDGHEMCKQLKSDVSTSHIPVILLTARGGEDNIIEGLESGADDYITKPFSTKILTVRIRNLIEIRTRLQQEVKRELALQPVKASMSKIDQEFLGELRQVIKKHIADPEFNVEGLSKTLYMSSSTLYRKIQALSGETPSEFIRSCRLKRAVQLLERGTGTVTEVAFEVGFTSRAYFTRCFKERFHRLPSETRKIGVK